MHEALNNVGEIKIGHATLLVRCDTVTHTKKDNGFAEGKLSCPTTAIVLGREGVSIHGKKKS